MRSWGAAFWLATWCAVAAGPAGGEVTEPPPPQGSRLHFEKRLLVQRTPVGKVFAETRRIEAGESLEEILSQTYKIPAEAIPTFVAAFRALNPAADPTRLRPGRVVWAPFKVVEDPAPPPIASEAATHTVRPGESLWKILQGRFGVPAERMSEALARVAEANPAISDLNLLWVGQKIAIPAAIAGSAQKLRTPAEPGLRPDRTVLDLLREIGCRVEETGETYLPLGRGHTVRLDGRLFPVLRGPTGGTVILDPEKRLSASLVRAVSETWGYEVFSGQGPDAETQLEDLLPRLRFHELSGAPRRILLTRGVELVALARWTVVPRQEHLWEGRVHLIFSQGAKLDPGYAQMARGAGFSIHYLGPPEEVEPDVGPLPALAEIRMGDAAGGASRLLALLGVPHRVRPEIECRLAEGVRYSVTPELTFRHEGLDYAVTPRSSPRVESVLSRAGYLTLTWPDEASPLARLSDLLRLLGVPHAQTAAEFPAGQAIRLRVSGVVLDEPRLAALLYPGREPAANPERRLFLTEARLPPEAMRGLVGQGLLPWLVVSR